MKLNLANPVTGLQKTIEVDDDRRLIPFFNQRMAAEVPADSLGDEFKGYRFKITGGNDKQGFPMMQGVLTNQRVRLLLKAGAKCFRPRRQGERKRKSIRGCIVGPDLSAMHLVMVKKGDEEIPGLTDGQVPRRLGPKRANNIRKMFGLKKGDDVTQFVVRRKIEKPNGKYKIKTPKIQRLVTPQRLRRKQALQKQRKARIAKSIANRAEFQAMIKEYKEEQKTTREADQAARKKAKDRKQRAKTSQPEKAE